MTDINDLAAKNAKVALQIAEINTKALIDVVNKQASSFSELLHTGLNQMKTLQTADSPQKLVDAQIEYGKNVEEKIKTIVSTNVDAVTKAQKEVLSLLESTNTQAKSSASK